MTKKTTEIQIIHKMQIVMVHESFLSSIAKDISSMGLIAILLFLNNRYFGNHGGVAFLLVLLILIYISIRAKKDTKNFYSKKDAIKWLQSK